MVTRYVKVYEDGALVAEEPYEVSDEQLALEAKEAAAEQAKADMSNHIFATVTATEAETWIENNVTTLATAKTALKQLAKFCIYLRDRNA